MFEKLTGSVPSSTSPLLLLLRHGAIASHRGDVPLTHDGRQQSERAGRSLAAMPLGRIQVLASPTRRTRETALLVVHGMTSAHPTLPVTAATESFALRNPDLYLAGERVDMVSSPAAFGEQVRGLTDEECNAVPFFARFLASTDRIGWWLHHGHPPGDDAATVAARILAFAASLGDVPGRMPDTVVGVTHSPVLRAVALRLLGEDPGEPAYLHGYALRLGPDRSAHLRGFDPFG